MKYIIIIVTAIVLLLGYTKVSYARGLHCALWDYREITQNTYYKSNHKLASSVTSNAKVCLYFKYSYKNGIFPNDNFIDTLKLQRV